MGDNIAEVMDMLRPLIKLKIAEYEVREGKKFNRIEACEYLRLSQQHLSGVITGSQQTTPERLFKLAKMLGCKVDDLYTLEE